MTIRSQKNKKHLMAMAHDLGQNKFAPRAAQLDRDAQFPFENYKDMKAAGLLALCVPEAHGGQGADYATYAMVFRRDWPLVWRYGAHLQHACVHHDVEWFVV